MPPAEFIVGLHYIKRIPTLAYIHDMLQLVRTVITAALGRRCDSLSMEYVYVKPLSL